MNNSIGYPTSKRHDTLAKTDFSSSSPLAGSFLTGRIYPECRDTLLWWAALYTFIFKDSSVAASTGISATVMPVK